MKTLVAISFSLFGGVNQIDDNFETKQYHGGDNMKSSDSKLSWSNCEEWRDLF